MSYTPNNNSDFENAIQYYFGDSQTLPGGTNATEKYIGRFIPDQQIQFTMKASTIRTVDNFVIINGANLTTSQLTNDEYILYPPFYDSTNSLLTTYLGIDMTGSGLYLDLNKPIKILINDPNADTFTVRATSNGETGNTYNATFVQGAYIEIFSKPKSLISNWNIINVTSLENTFKDRTTFNEQLNNWNTSNITSLRGTFRNARSFNQPIGSWNTSKVVDMILTFQDAIVFNQAIGSWDTSKVTNMSSMFQRGIAFNQAIGSWNTSNCQDMSYMLQGCRAFNKPLGSWNTSKVVNMANMFRDCILFNQDITGWNVLNVADMSSMFRGASVFNQLIRLWVVDRNVVLTDMFLGAVAMLNHYLGTQYFGSTPTYRYFGYTFDYVPSKDCGDEGIQGSSGRCKEKPEYKQLDTGGNDPKFNPAYAYALYIRGSLGRSGYHKFNIGNRELNELGSYEGAPGSGVRAPPRNTFG
jgi:surface protein